MVSAQIDVNHVLVRRYHHLGEDIGFGEVMRFRQELTEAIVEILQKEPRQQDSPVYAFLHGLEPPTHTAAMRTAGRKSATAGDGSDGTAGEGVTPKMEAVHSILMQQVDDVQKRGDFVQAKSLLSSMREMMRTNSPTTSRGALTGKVEDPYIIQRLALITYKSQYPTEEAALKEARDVLLSLNPETSNDTETLGLWGAVHKRLWQLTQNPAHLDESVRGYERGFYLRNDYSNGINLAYLLNIRAAHTASLAQGIADFVQAQRIRREVITICQRWLASEHPAPEARYWVQATMAEAYVGIGDAAEGQRILDEACAMAPAAWMVKSTREQIGRLGAMLADSPLKYIKTDATQV